MRNFDWTVLPVPDGGAAPLSEDYNLIENNVPNPVPADIDNDGQWKSCIPPTMAACMPIGWIKPSTATGLIRYITLSDGYFTFATEPVVADLYGDAHAEIIFASWVQKGTGQTGKLYILDYLGNLCKSLACRLPLAEVMKTARWQHPRWRTSTRPRPGGGVEYAQFGPGGL